MATPTASNLLRDKMATSQPYTIEDVENAMSEEGNNSKKTSNVQNGRPFWWRWWCYLIIALMMVVVVLVVIIGSVWYVNAGQTVPAIRLDFNSSAKTEATAAMDNSAWADVLAKYTYPNQISPTNNVSYVAVDYARLGMDRGKLDEYIDQLKNLNSSAISSMSRDEALALYINAYNAFAISKVLSSGDNKIASIRDLGTFLSPVWRQPAGEIAGQTLSLDQIEHGIIRANWPDEPRIHAAVNCASVSCPDLRQEPYTGKDLQNQLDDQTCLWLSNAGKGVAVTADGGLAVSKLFDWYGGDFSRQAGGSVAAWIVETMNKCQSTSMAADVEIKTYLPYDWNLNNATQ